MTDQLRQAAQAVVDRWDTPAWEWSEKGPTAAKIADLRTALEQQAEPVSHAAIAGALFDFMGWLTTRKERLVLSSVDNASPAADAIKAFAEMRGLSLDDARVQDWNTSLPQQQAEPVFENLDYVAVVYSPSNAMLKSPLPIGTHLYKYPPQRPWVGLTDEDFLEACQLAEHGNYLVAFQRIQTKLKERNNV